MQDSKKLVASFFNNILKKEAKKDILFLNFYNTLASSKLFNISYPNLKELNNEIELTKIQQKLFDSIIGIFPLGMPLMVLDTISKVSGRKNWSFILDSLKLLNENGQAFFMVEPNLIFSLQGKRFLNDLFNKGFFYNSVFELPEKYLQPETSIRPYIIQFEKKKQEKLFIAEITSEFEQMLKNFYLKVTTNNLENGTLVGREEFESFSKYKINREMINLQTQYKEYEKYSLENIAYEINTTRTNFDEKPNSIYIPSIGTSKITSNIKLTTIKHQNLFQVVLKTEFVKSEYLAMFFNSRLGKKLIQNLFTDSFIPKIRKSDIGKCIIFLPSLAEQALLIFTDTKLSELQTTIDELKNELSINPKNANLILEKFDKIHKPLKDLSEEEKIIALIEKGEDARIEFKETFSKSIRTGNKEEAVEKSALKTIVGFLNSDGGTLLIGVSDDKIIKGVENDIFVSKDKYLLKFKDSIRDKIGLEYNPFIEYDLFLVRNKNILKVECKPSSKPCFYEEKEFFIRSPAATDKLEGNKQLAYIKEHFKDNA